MSAPTTLTISYGSGSPATIPRRTISAGSVGGVSQAAILEEPTAALERSRR
jgi:hypothetical protein